MLKISAEVLAKVAAADKVDQQNAWDYAFYKTASEQLNLSEAQALKLRELVAAEAAKQK